MGTAGAHTVLVSAGDAVTVARPVNIVCARVVVGNLAQYCDEAP